MSFFSDLSQLAAAVARIWSWAIGRSRSVKHSIEMLLLLRAVGIHMLQNRPPVQGNEQDERRAEQIFNWWEEETIRTLGKARVLAGEVAEFQDLGNMFQPTIITEKLDRLHKIIKRLEGR